MPVPLNQTTRCHIPQDPVRNLHGRDNLKPHNFNYCLENHIIIQNGELWAQLINLTLLFDVQYVYSDILIAVINVNLFL